MDKNIKLFVTRTGKSGYIIFEDESKSEEFTTKGQALTLLLQQLKEQKISEEEFTDLRNQILDSKLAWEKGPEQKTSIKHFGIVAVVQTETSVGELNLPDEELRPMLFICNNGVFKQAMIVFKDGYTSNPINNKKDLMEMLDISKEKECIDEAGYAKIKAEIASSPLLENKDQLDTVLKQNNCLILSDMNEAYLLLCAPNERAIKVQSKKHALDTLKVILRLKMITEDAYNALFKEVLELKGGLPWNHEGGDRITSGGFSMGSMLGGFPFSGLGGFGGMKNSLDGLLDLFDMLTDDTDNLSTKKKPYDPKEHGAPTFKVCDCSKTPAHGYLYLEDGQSHRKNSKETAMATLNYAKAHGMIDEAGYEKVKAEIASSPLAETEAMVKETTE